MGFIKKGEYTVKDLGIAVPNAYAKIGHVSINEAGFAHATFNIQQNREDAIQKNPLERISITATIDKTQPIYAQLYVIAKESEFADWEDDIIEEIVEE